MKVTDPALLAQLNGSSGQSDTKVTDPILLAQLNGTSQQNPQQDQSFGGQLLDATENTIIGAGDSVNNFARQLSNFVLPKSMQAKMLKQGDGLSYDAGKFIGDVGTFGLGGGALNSARSAAESLPVVGKLAEALGGQGYSGIARRALGTGAYGAAQNPEDRGVGALEGAGLSAGIDLATKGSSKFMPKKYMEQVYESVSNGLKNAKQESKKMYGQVMENFGNQPIMLKGIDPDIFQKNTKLRNVYNDFRESPTIYNAHRLQSQLGSADRQSKGIDIATKDRKDAYRSSRESILGNIDRALGSKFPEAAKKYAEAANHYRENVLPYEITNTALRKINQATPEKVRNKLEAVTKTNAYPKNKVGVNDVPLVPQEILKLGNELSNRIANRNRFQVLGGMAAGTATGHSLGIPAAGELIGAYFGSKAPDALKRIGSFSKNHPAKSALASELSRIYSPSNMLKTEVLG
jgi:hypothetical protein